MSFLFPKLLRNVVGMIHLPALPGSPAASMGVQEIVDVACEEAETYARVGGVDAVIVENMNDLPYCKVILTSDGLRQGRRNSALMSIDEAGVVMWYC